MATFQLRPTIGLVIATVAVGFTQTASAQDTCAASYQAASQAVQNVAARGLKTSLTRKVDSAHKQALIGDRGHLNAASRMLDAALRQIGGQPGARTIPAGDLTALVDIVSAFRSCVEGQPPAQMATLTVRTFLVSDIAADHKGPAAGAGITILVDTVSVGTTDAAGTATIQVPARPITVGARQAPSSYGEAPVSLTAGQAGSVEIILEDGKEVYEEADLELVEAPTAVLNRAFTSFTLRFVDAQDQTAALADLDSVLISDTFNGPKQNIATMFAVQPDGTLKPSNPDALRALLLARTGGIQLAVHAEDAANKQYDGTIVFFVSSFRVVGQLVAPPSFAGLTLGGITVRATVLNTPLIFTVVTDSAGKFEFPLLPSGNLEFKAETQQLSKFYYGQGIFVLNGNKLLTVNMLNTADLIAGVLPFTVTPF